MLNNDHEATTNHPTAGMHDGVRDDENIWTISKSRLRTPEGTPQKASLAALVEQLEFHKRINEFTRIEFFVPLPCETFKEDQDYLNALARHISPERPCELQIHDYQRLGGEYFGLVYIA